MARSPLLIFSAVLVGSAVGVLAAALWPGDKPVRVLASSAEAPAEEGGRVSLRIRCAEGGPELRAATVQVRSEQDAELRPLAFDRPGERSGDEPPSSVVLAPDLPFLSRQPLTPGDYRMVVIAEDFAPAEVSFKIQPGRVTAVEVAMSAD